MAPSVLVLTLNEEANLPACLASLAWSDDIVVLDSFSTDRTVEIAREAGARVYQRRFDDWATHQNWAVGNIEFKHPWVYYSDADERMPEDLAREIQAVTNDPKSDAVAYRLRFRNMLQGRWIKHASLYPTWVMRLFRPDHIRWERVVNPVPVIDGREGRLQCHFEHRSFNKGMSEWLAKHNRYSDGEARELVRSLGEPLVWRDLLTRAYGPRRRALKNLAFRLPGRPFLVFFYLYVVRLGFLDGRAGLTYCTLRAIYETMIDVKVRELARRAKGLPL